MAQADEIKALLAELKQLREENAKLRAENAELKARQERTEAMLLEAQRAPKRRRPAPYQRPGLLSQPLQRPVAHGQLIIGTPTKPPQASSTRTA